MVVARKVCDDAAKEIVCFDILFSIKHYFLIISHTNADKTMLNMLMVFIGGGFGSVCRYGIQLALAKYENGFPIATLAANLVSSLILGMLLAFSTQHILSAQARLLFATGFCGGLSTFSTYSAESLLMIQQGAWFYSLLNLLGSMILGLLGVFVGMKLAS